jgi:hypothetical protein
MSEARPHLYGMLAGLFLAAGLVVSSMLGTAAWVKIKNSQFVTVKGSARKSIESDLAVWHGSYVVEAETLLEAQRKILADRVVVEKFLAGAGLTNFSFAALGIEEERATKKSADGWAEQRTSGYRLSQAVRVETTDLDRIERLDSTPLVEQGLLFTADPPQYIYTSVGEAKIEMLAEAAKDARARAEQIAGQGGRRIAQLHAADQGIFQITPQHGTDTSGEGLNDITSRQKTITAVVTATFLLK